MREKQPISSTYGNAQVNGDTPQKTSPHSPYGHTTSEETSESATNGIRPEENDKNPNMPCKNSLPT